MAFNYDITDEKLSYIYWDEATPLEKLRRLNDLENALYAARAEYVILARAEGQTWETIGGALRMSKQAAAKKYRAAFEFRVGY